MAMPKLPLQQPDGQRAVYHRKTPYSPYQNQAPAFPGFKKKYTISAPAPGQKADVFRGIDTLKELKQRSATSKRSMLSDVPVGLQSRFGRVVLKITPRSTDGPSSSTVTQESGESIQEDVRIEDEGMLGALERRKLSFGVSCSECDLSFYSRNQLCEHVQNAHGIPAPIITKEFDTELQFNTWVLSLKRSHCVDFIHASGSRSWPGREQKITYLQCSRSGDPKVLSSRSTRKPRSTIKSGKTCLAYLKVRQTLRHGRLWGPIRVEGCLQHSGHNIDPEKFILSYEEEQAIFQLCERHSKTSPVDLNMARAILDPCPRLRLVTHEDLLQTLPRWMYDVGTRWIRSEGDEGRSNNVLDNDDDDDDDEEDDEGDEDEERERRRMDEGGSRLVIQEEIEIKDHIDRNDDSIIVNNINTTYPPLEEILAYEGHDDEEFIVSVV